MGFLVKCSVAASMEKILYDVYVRLCQDTGEVLYGKCSCNAWTCGRCKHYATLLYQLCEYIQLDLKCVQDDKTCTVILQKSHAPSESRNNGAILFSELTFIKADQQKENKSRKRPFATGERYFCVTPLFDREVKSEKIE